MSEAASPLFSPDTQEALTGITDSLAVQFSGANSTKTAIPAPGPTPAAVPIPGPRYHSGKVAGKKMGDSLADESSLASYEMSASVTSQNAGIEDDDGYESPSLSPVRPARNRPSATVAQDSGELATASVQTEMDTPGTLPAPLPQEGRGTVHGEYLERTAEEDEGDEEEQEQDEETDEEDMMARKVTGDADADTAQEVFADDKYEQMTLPTQMETGGLDQSIFDFKEWTPNVGGVVDADWKGNGKWYTGTVVHKNGDGTFKINYVDGDTENAVHVRSIRAPLARRRRTAVSSEDTAATSDGEIAVVAVGTGQTAFETEWEYLTGEQKRYASSMGFKTNASWSRRLELITIMIWSDLSHEQQFAAEVLGFQQLAFAADGSTGSLAEDQSPKKVGDSIEANFKSSGNWYGGTIVEINMDGTFAVNYVDGDFEPNVKRCDIRAMIKRRRAATGAEAKTRALLAAVDMRSFGASGQQLEAEVVGSQEAGEKEEQRKETRPVAWSPKKGESVEADWKGSGQWHGGVVVTENEDGTFNIKYGDGDDEKSVKRSRLRQMPRRRRTAVDMFSPGLHHPAAAGVSVATSRESVCWSPEDDTAPAVGLHTAMTQRSTHDEAATWSPKNAESVEADWNERGKWCDGVVVGENADGNFSIQYVDGETEETTDDEKHAPWSPRKGNSVEANWNESGRWFGGTIVAENKDGTFVVEYVDGDVEQTVTRERMRRMLTRQEAAALAAKQKKISSKLLKKKNLSASREAAKAAAEAIEAADDDTAEEDPGDAEEEEVQASEDEETGNKAEALAQAEEAAAQAEEAQAAAEEQAETAAEKAAAKAEAKAVLAVKTENAEGKASLKAEAAVEAERFAIATAEAAEAALKVGDQQDSDEGDDTDVGGGAGWSPKTGESMEADWNETGKWFGGLIEEENEDGTFNIQYLDGDKEESVERERIRQMPTRQELKEQAAAAAARRARKEQAAAKMAAEKVTLAFKAQVERAAATTASKAASDAKGKVAAKAALRREAASVAKFAAAAAVAANAHLDRVRECRQKGPKADPQPSKTAKRAKVSGVRLTAQGPTTVEIRKSAAEIRQSRKVAAIAQAIAENAAAKSEAKAALAAKADAAETKAYSRAAEAATAAEVAAVFADAAEAALEVGDQQDSDEGDDTDVGGGAGWSPKTGESVEADWNETGKYFGGLIEEENEDGTFNIQYLDGDKEESVRREHIRQMMTRKEVAAAAARRVSKQQAAENKAAKKATLNAEAEMARAAATTAAYAVVEAKGKVAAKTALKRQAAEEAAAAAAEAAAVVSATSAAAGAAVAAAGVAKEATKRGQKRAEVVGARNTAKRAKVSNSRSNLASTESQTVASTVHKLADGIAGGLSVQTPSGWLWQALVDCRDRAPVDIFKCIQAAGASSGGLDRKTGMAAHGGGVEAESGALGAADMVDRVEQKGREADSEAERVAAKSAKATKAKAAREAAKAEAHRQVRRAT
jgi:hypothetical protein